ncbi:MAG TPA: biotin/lipoyl-binding protein, partial [Rhizobiales bacterium]|nr:biotin/lipoyl-binding protein [Hyphomicrobiales bacterium]
HIEIQILGDNHGNVVQLWERDCSAQRRHQKVIEESPAPGMLPETRKAMIKAAIEAARAVNYTGAGTVEFIAQGGKQLSPDSFWFLEMNPRLQVEHPVTEMVTGLDLVEWQLRIADGETLPSRLASVRANGHAIEARLYAESPENGFLPSTGTLARLEFAADSEHERVDTGVRQGGRVTPYYDPMIAKLIAWGTTRKAAIARLDAMIRGSLVAGVKTNAAFLSKLVTSSEFMAGGIDTDFIERHLEELTCPDFALRNHLIRAGAAHEILRRAPKGDDSPWGRTDGWQLGGERRIGLDLGVDGETLGVQVMWQKGKCEVMLPGDPPIPGDAPQISLIEVPDGVYAACQAVVLHICLKQSEIADEAASPESGCITAPMPGKILQMEMNEGQSLKKGETLVILEAMKMEHALKAPYDARVLQIRVKDGDQVEEGAVLMEIEPSENDREKDTT